MNHRIQYAAMAGLSLLWMTSGSAVAQVHQDTIVVSTGFGSTLSREGNWGTASYLHLWSGIIAGRQGEWRPYASVSIPMHTIRFEDRVDFEGNRRDRYNLSAINVGGTYSINNSLTGYVGGGWTRRRGDRTVGRAESIDDSFKEDSINATVGLLIHTGMGVGINVAVGANPGTASLAINFRF